MNHRTNGDGAGHTALGRPLKSPPFDAEAEAAVLASCLLDNGQIPDAAAILPDASAFWRDDHARLWDAILGMWRDGRPVDTILLAAEMERLGHGYPAPGLTPDDPVIETMAGHSLSWDATRYALAVRRAAQLRAVIDAADEMSRDAYRNRDEPEAVVGRASERLEALRARELSGSTDTMADLMPGVMGRILSRQDGRPTGILTPWAELNGLTDGIQPTDFLVVAGRPSMGKTSYALNLAEHAAVDWGVPTLFVSLEMGNPLLAERMLVSRSGLDGHGLRTGRRLSHRDRADLDRARAELEAAPVRLVRRPGRSLSEVVSEVRLAHARHGIGLIVVDYVQLIRSDNPRESEVQALTRISGDLKGLTTRLGVPVVALSQLNRGLESREEKRPRMSDIRGSGSIEQDADLIVLLHRPEYFDPNDSPGLAEVILGKNRNGPPGEFKLVFVKSRMRFENHDPGACYVPPPIDTADF